MIQDLHSHTYYSFCGHDSPETVIQAAVSGGIDLIGICDHNYGIALQRSIMTFPDEERRQKDYQRTLNAYYDHIRMLAERYKEDIRVLCGIEIATIDRTNWPLPDGVDVSFFDYCLIESVDAENSVASDLFSFTKRCGTKVVGVAHTDLFSYLERSGQDALSYFSRMADHNIFWEMNVNFDSTHHYRFHSYVTTFFESEYQQEIIRKSGVKLSVGFDGHKIEDYQPQMVRDYCQKIKALNLPLAFSE